MFEKKCEQIEKKYEDADEAEDALTRFSSHFDEARIDKQGRMAIDKIHQQFLRLGEKAEERTVAVVGHIKYVGIWNIDAHQEFFNQPKETAAA